MRRVTWIDPDGITLPLNLNEGPVVLQPGASFAGTPPVRTTLDQVPLQSGSRWRYADHGPRELALPIVVMGATPAALEAAYDELAHRFDPTRGDGRLRITRSSGEVRELSCRLVDTMALEEPYGDVTEWFGVLVLRAADPYYTDVSDTAIAVGVNGTVIDPGTPGTPATTFSDPTEGFSDSDVPMNGVVGTGSQSPTFTGSRSFFPFFPLRLGASEVMSGFAVNNTGQALVWPVWTITGPATGITITNDTTGESFELAYTLGVGETITIDTRPGRKVIVDQNGASLFPITGTSSLFPFVVGSNRISVTMAGSSAASAVVARWRRRWLSA